MIRPLCCWLLLLGKLAAAQETVQVPVGRYGVDYTLQLVVVAMGGSEIQAQWPGDKVAVEVEGTSFALAVPQAVLVTGEAYELVSQDGSTYTLYCTELPLFHVRTPHAIVDEPKVPGMLSGWSGEELIEDQALGIEIRGGSSLTYPKKSFLIELVTDTLINEQMDRSLLGLRSDDDWNLQAGYIEPNRLRSVVGMELWSDLHALYYADEEPEALTGVRMRHFELFINDSYRGLYALSERVDRKQLQLKQYNGTIRGELYKGIGWGGSTFTSIPPPFAQNAVVWGGWEHVHPEGNPNWAELSELVSLVVNGTEPNIHALMRQRFHLPTMVDYHLFLNLLKAEDNTGKNIFLARYDEGEPYFYVPWDLDATFGLSWNGLFNVSTDLFLSNGVYARWFTDLSPGGFVESMCERWTELRAGPFTVEAIMDRFHAHYARLVSNGVYTREELAWPAYVHDPDHLQAMAGWIEQRIAYMDQELGSYCRLLSVAEHQGNYNFRVAPNPAQGWTSLQLPDESPSCSVVLVNSLGQSVRQYNGIGNGSALDLAGITPGAYVLVLQQQGAVLGTARIVVE
ncbi:MAG: CotH kinase family protein [Flavobacteriales bacterium]|nr:CotH kinase family protein [Flavobacteriales bacterium]